MQVLASSFSRRVLLALLWLAGLCVISALSGYDVTHVGSINFDIATMLTPLGLVRTFVFHQQAELREYYFQPASLEPAKLSQVFFALSVLLFQAVSFAGLVWLKWGRR